MGYVYPLVIGARGVAEAAGSASACGLHPASLLWAMKAADPAPEAEELEG